jgi:hypothetical protein
MSEKIEITVDAIDNASRKIDDLARNMDQNFDDINRSSSDLETKQKSLDRTIQDTSTDATRNVEKASSEIKKNYDAVGKASDDVKQKHESLSKGTKDIVTGFSGVATSAFSLYMTYDRVETSAVALDRANLMVKQSANSVEDAQNKQTKAGADLEKAQEALSQAIEQYGSDSDEAAKAQEIVNQKLLAYQGASADAQLSTEKYNVAVERADLAQGNFTQSIIQSALQIVPTAITLIDNIGKVSKAFTNLKDLDFSALILKLGGVTTAEAEVEAGAVSATTAITTMLTTAGAIATVAGAAYVGAVTGPPKTEAAITGAAVPGGLPTAGPKTITEMVGLPSLELLPGATSVILKPTAPKVTTPTTPTTTPTPAPTPVPSGKPVFSGTRAQYDALPWDIKQYYSAPAMQEGGIVTRPTMALIGEAGPEAVIPLNRASMTGQPIYNINNTIRVEGSIDERTLRVIEKRLENVLIEATSPNALSTRKRIRFGSMIG